MKIRTTLKDVKQLVCFGFMSPNEFSLTSVPVPVPQVAPRPDDKMNHSVQGKPLTDADYNCLSIADMEVFNSYRGMDELHKQDAVAADYRNSLTRKQYLKNEGAKDFAARYLKKK